VFERPVLGVQTHFSPELCGTNWCRQQIPHSDEVVSSGRKGEHPSNFQDTAMSGFAQHADRLQPAEDFFYPLAPNLTDFVSGVPRRTLIDRAAARTFVILCHMRCDVHTRISRTNSFVS